MGSNWEKEKNCFTYTQLTVNIPDATSNVERNCDFYILFTFYVLEIQNSFQQIIIFSRNSIVSLPLSLGIFHIYTIDKSYVYLYNKQQSDVIELNIKAWQIRSVIAD